MIYMYIILNFKNQISLELIEKLQNGERGLRFELNHILTRPREERDSIFHRLHYG